VITTKIVPSGLNLIVDIASAKLDIYAVHFIMFGLSIKMMIGT